jgi:hypothetical protein
MTSRKWRRVALVAGLVVAIGWLAVSAVLLVQARAALGAGGDDLAAVRAKASIATLLEPATRDDLDDARAELGAAERALRSPVLAPIRLVPVVGHQVRAAAGLAAAGADGAAAASDALDDLAALAARSQVAGPDRLATLDELAMVADRAGAELGALDVGDGRGLVGPLADAVAEVGDQQAKAVEAADDLAQASRALRSVLAGPAPYLLLGANNAEMRHGSGMYLSAAELGFADGSLRLGPVAPTAELVLPADAVPVDGDLAENWPWLDVGRDLRNLGFSADLPQVLEVAVRTWEATPEGGEVAGAIVVDVDGLRSLLRVVGPVEVDGVRYTADSVRGELLREQYRRFGDDRVARRDQLGEVARAVLAKVDAGAWDLDALATELADAVQGRHLAIWSADPELADAWAEVGADGHLDDRSVAVGVVNRAATKIDSWVATEAEVVASPPSDGRRAVTLTLTVENDAPAAGPPYLVGPNVDGLEAGDHRGIVVVNLPAGTTDVEIDGARQVLDGGDGPTVVVAGELTVGRGERAEVVVRGVLPAGLDEITIEPSARIPRTRWVVDGTELGRDRRTTVALGS